MQSSYSTLDPTYYPLPSLVEDTMRCCLEYIFISNHVFVCEWSTTLSWYKLVDRWIRRDSFPRLDEWREGKCFNSGRNWLDERLEAYLICVSHGHGWISLFNEFWLFYSVAEWRMWTIWSRHIKISDSGNVDKCCARNNPVVKVIEPEYWFCVFMRLFFSRRWSAR